MGDKRKQRAAQYEKDAVPYMLSPNLIYAAVCALRASLSERHGRVMRNPTTHASSSALGAIILFATAIDVALNEIITCDKVLAAADTAPGPSSMVEKFCGITALGVEHPVAVELNCLSNMRDELVHYLPRQVEGPGSVPEWFRGLYERGGFIGTGRESDFLTTSVAPVSTGLLS